MFPYIKLSVSEKHVFLVISSTSIPLANTFPILPDSIIAIFMTALFKLTIVNGHHVALTGSIAI